MWTRFLQDFNGITFFRSLRLFDSAAINLQAHASKKGFGLFILVKKTKRDFVLSALLHSFERSFIYDRKQSDDWLWPDGTPAILGVIGV